VGRANRFAVVARARGRRLYLHLPNPGRMTELLRPGTVGLAHLHTAGGRRTHGVLLLVRHRGRWVGMDARLPNTLFAAAVAHGMLRPFRGYHRWRAEVRIGRSRFDFLGDGPKGRCVVETKSANLVVGATALFPDAPTARGTQHLAALARMARRGVRAAVVWFVQRDDAAVLRPFAQADPRFARAVVEAARAGVRLYAFTCRMSPRGARILRSIPVRPGHPGPSR
jgi:sugar fermentation stimulation protein A